jgi:hypothetical protein
MKKRKIFYNQIWSIKLLFFSFNFIILTSLYSGVGTTGGQFLKIGPSARALGMSGSFGAVCDDIFAIHYNPAGLVQLNTQGLAMTYLRYFEDVNYGFVGYAKPSETDAIGFGLTYLIVDKIEARSGDTELPSGFFNAEDVAVTIAYAKKEPFKTLPKINFGGSLRLITSEIENYRGYTVSADLGAYYVPVDKLSLALVVQNISYGIKYNEETDMLPLNLKFASAYKMKENLLLASDIDTYLIDTKFYASVGIEFLPIKQLLLRVGYRYGYDTASLGSIVGLGVGIGFKIWNFGLDYAFVPFGDLGNTHRISFGMRF